MKIIGYVIHPYGSVDGIVVKNMFEVREKLIGPLIIVEEEIIKTERGQFLMRYLKTPELRRVEEGAEELMTKVLYVLTAVPLLRPT